MKTEVVGFFCEENRTIKKLKKADVGVLKPRSKMVGQIYSSCPHPNEGTESGQS